MSRVVIQAGDKFGKLTVIREAEVLRHNDINYRQAELLCECGNTTVKKIVYLRNGQTKSCGCEKWKGTPKDITGKVSGRLTAIKSLDKSPNGDFYWECLCECGQTTKVTIGNFNFGHTRSCGCLGDAHPYSGTPTHQSWKKMLDRTRYEEYYEWHGDVSVCDSWNTQKGGSFDNFFNDMGERPEGTSLNRINGSKIYSPVTCEWATYSVQSYDQRMKSTNTSGRTGVRWREERGVWEARISKDDKKTIVYYGPSFEDACKARAQAEIELYGFTKE